MKKQINSTKTLFVVALLSAVLYLASCGNKAASIVGTWTPVKFEQVTKVNGATVSDTVINGTASVENLIGVSSLIFNSNGQYTAVNYPGGADSVGNYTFSGSSLTFTTGTLASSPPKSENVSINGNTAVISFSPDTVSTSPLAINLTTLTVTR